MNIKLLKKYISTSLKNELVKQNLSKSEMARKMRTSRAVVDRLLDEENTSFTFNNLCNALNVLEKDILFDFTDNKKNKKTFEQGFEIYMDFFNKPIEYNTILRVEGYEPRKLNGFIIESRDPNYELDEEQLKVFYKRFLDGNEGNYENF